MPMKKIESEFGNYGNNNPVHKVEVNLVILSFKKRR